MFIESVILAVLLPNPKSSKSNAVSRSTPVTKPFFRVLNFTCMTLLSPVANQEMPKATKWHSRDPTRSMVF